eukprot:TRINITY_DN7534_c0_g1_i1.p1 TRINITY_DN7534_c0_g1~~TRINITY_DN7534_c0_g1_i1.p1  ORF type:complete len:451 (+),score=197.47 TRINITY_DN7534_c0_g1_i1:54-1406(+)
MERLDNFIDGKFVAPQEGNYMDNFEPARGTVYGQLAKSTAPDVEAAVAAADKAFPAWSALSAGERAVWLRRVADAIEARLDEFAAAESRDQGKPVALARRIDIPRAVQNFRFFASAVEQHEDRCTHRDSNVFTYTQSRPLGVACLISPWNLPLYLLTWKIAPAIACGNTCVCKPSEFTSATAILLCKVLVDIEFPRGVVNVVLGTGPEAGAPLVQHKRVPLVSFTGGTATGKLIQRDALERMKKVSLELGGKNPNIVFADADLDKCLSRSLLSSFANQGEICLCGSRIYVQRAVYDDFVARFVALTRELVVGDPSAPTTFMGALASAQHRDKVASYVALAVEEGGKIECGGRAPTIAGFENGYWFEPTVITGLTNQCRVQQEEIFGPVVTITPFDTDEEVIGLANDSVYGLSATVWTESLTRAHKVAHALDTGTVWINWYVTQMDVVQFS